MRFLVPVYVCALGLAGPARSQPADSPALRAEMVAAAVQLLETVAGEDEFARERAERLGLGRADGMAFAAGDPERTNWQFWPTQRIGLPLWLMSKEQRRLTHELLRAVMSSSGYLKTVQVMQLDELMASIDEVGNLVSMDHYRLAIFGEPSIDSVWGWRFEGHHVSLNVSVGADQIIVTPTFLGANPAEVQMGLLAGLRVHGAVEDMARELVESLDENERRIAVVSEQVPADILTTQQNLARDEWSAWLEAVQPEGIAVAELNEVQQHWVRRIVAEVVSNYRDELAEPIADRIDIERMSFAWMGSTARGHPHYFRLQDTDFIFEYDNAANDGNHVHSVWRSKSSDFGGRALLDHYRAAAH